MTPRALVLAALCVAGCNVEPTQEPVPYAGPREGYDSIPSCGTAFLYELTDGPIDLNQECQGWQGKHGPSSWKSPRYIRIDWKDDSGEFVDGERTEVLRSRARGPDSCSAEFYVTTEDSHEVISHRVDFNTLTGKVTYGLLSGGKVVTCSTSNFTLRPIPR